MSGVRQGHTLDNLGTQLDFPNNLQLFSNSIVLDGSECQKMLRLGKRLL